MSCFIVSDATIDVLVNAAAAYGILGGRSPREIGATLRAENVASYSYRYAHLLDEPGEREMLDRSYVLTTTEAPLHPVAVAKAEFCYRYQACEHPEWGESWSDAFCETLVKRAEEDIPNQYNLLTFHHGSQVPRYWTGNLWYEIPYGFRHVDDAATYRWADMTPWMRSPAKNLPARPEL